MVPLSGSSGNFEVQTGREGRWTINNSFPSQDKAIAHAKAMLKTGHWDAARVLKTQGNLKPKVVFQEEGRRGERPLNIIPVEWAPFCENIEDFYSFDARRTAGWLLRRWLDHHHICALEMLFTSGQLKLFQRKDNLLPQAVGSLAKTQAKLYDLNVSDRSNFLYTMVNRLTSQAQDFEDRLPRSLSYLKAEGLPKLVAKAKEQAPAQAEQLIFGTLAMRLSEAGDWDEKTAFMIDFIDPLAEGDPHVRYCDEIIAEILDGAEAVTELLRGQKDMAAAISVLATLCVGRATDQPLAGPAFPRLNALMSRSDMHYTRMVLLERVQREMASVKPLTREGKEADQAAFKRLMHDFGHVEGIIGGSTTAETLIQRARILFSDEDGNIPADKAIIATADLMASKAAAVSFLIDLADTDIGRAQEATVVSQIAYVINRIPSAGDLLDHGHDTKEVLKATEILLDKMQNAEGLPETWQPRFIKKLQELLSEYRSTGGKMPAQKKPSAAKGKQMSDQPLKRRKIAAGDFLFHEGEPGDEAYLLISGRLEINRKTGNTHKVVATVGRGNIVGEMALIDDQPRMASAKAVEDTMVTVIPVDSFKARLDRLNDIDPVMRRLLDIFVNRIRQQTKTAR